MQSFTRSSALFLALALAACGWLQPNPLLGTWELRAEGELGQMVQGLLPAELRRIEFTDGAMVTAAGAQAVTYAVRDSRTVIVTVTATGATETYVIATEGADTCFRQPGGEMIGIRFCKVEKGS